MADSPVMTANLILPAAPRVPLSPVRLWVLGLFANITCFVSLFPFVSPLPLTDTDTQLFASFVCAILAGFTWVIEPSLLSLRLKDWLILGATVLSMLYSDWYRIPPDRAWFRSCCALLVGLPVYFAVRSLYTFISPRAVLMTGGVYLLSQLWQTISPAAFESVAIKVMPAVRYVEDFGRGAGGFCLEPSQMGMLGVALYSATHLVNPCKWTAGQKITIRLVAIAIVMLACSVSGFAVATVVGIRSALGSKRQAAWAIVVLICLVVTLRLGRIVDVPNNNRSLAYVSDGVDNPASIIADVSFWTRHVSTLGAIADLVHRPFGTRSRAFDDSVVYGSFGGRDLGQALSQAARISGGNPSDLGRGLQRMGLVYLLIIGMLVVFCGTRTERLLGPILFLGFLANGSLAASIIWFLVGCGVGNTRFSGDGLYQAVSAGSNTWRALEKDTEPSSAAQSGTL